ncbi:MAG: hypothetical protein WC959_05615 [Kiritimatiellales bacterium]
MKKEKVSFSGRIDRLLTVFDKKKDLEDRLNELGISRSTLHRLLSGKQEVTPNHLEKLSLLEQEYGFESSSYDFIISRMLESRLENLHVKLSSWDAVSEIIGMSSKECRRLLKKDALPPRSVITVLEKETRQMWSTSDQVQDALDSISEVEAQLKILTEKIAKTRVAVGMILRLEYDPLELLLKERESELLDKK